MHINRINLSEYELVTGLFNKYRMFYKQSSDMPLAEQFIKERLTNHESVIFVAFVDDKGERIPAGFTQLYPVFSSMRASKNWLLNDLYVDEAFLRQGIGGALIKIAMDFALAENASYVRLETAVDNYTAQKLYETIGFIKQEPAASFITYQINVR